MRQSLSNGKPMGEQIMERYQLAQEYVRANQNVEAITVIEEIHTKIAHIPKESIRAILRDFNNLLPHPRGCDIDRTHPVPNAKTTGKARSRAPALGAE